MKIVVIKLETVDVPYASFILSDIVVKIDKGYTSGMGSPVDWHIENATVRNLRLSSIIDQVRELRDADSHLCAADEHDNPTCSCHKYDAIIDSVENEMFNEE